ncbi:methionine ABC transporter ATP-binding protein [Microbacterium saperdae]|uniref:D-methionine transport system ATP-binding protein n=1 Tax=Microbacterium saperdae TaxID=69368 RepID=A0A543BQS1_9MICO|nr:methionine ABC transporter ATP-binding protein [Microbacterium saperdae]TQL87157.1 D-methionine transport system ATP-binding protein [Microbacterium saperdae]GGM42509.1 methionine import ATP-binding protein MetN [Microbacterium saperdae]
MTIITFNRVSKGFPPTRRGSAVSALEEVDLQVERGSIVGVIGYSGAGKSTLVRLVNGLEKPTAGTVEVLGVDVGKASANDLRGLRGRIGMIFQQFNLFNSRTVRGNVAYPLKVAGWKKQDIGPRVAELLDFVGIGDKAHSYPRALSGGQKQRVGIARAIAANPELLLADEATSALDPQTTGEVLALLKEINRTLGITIVVITHQISVVHELCDQVIVMDGGKVVDSGDTYRVFAHPRAALTERFVAAVTQGIPAGDTLDALLVAGGDLISADVNEFTSEHIAQVFDRHGVRHTVVFGGVTDIRGRQLGTLTYRVHAEAAVLASVVAELQEHTRAQILQPGPAASDQRSEVAS